MSAKCRRGIGDLESYVGRQSIECRSILDRQSIDTRSTLDRQSTECRSSVDRLSTATSTDIAVDIAVDITYSKHDPKKIVNMFCNESVLDPAVEEKKLCLITS